MEAKIAGLDAIHNKANALGVALMVGAVEKVGLEMDVMVFLGGLLITNVSLNHQVYFLRLQITKSRRILNIGPIHLWWRILKFLKFVFCWTM